MAHTFQFIGDLAANEVIDGDTIHIYQQVGGIAHAVTL